MFRFLKTWSKSTKAVNMYLYAGSILKEQCLLIYIPHLRTNKRFDCSEEALFGFYAFLYKKRHYIGILIRLPVPTVVSVRRPCVLWHGPLRKFKA
jgi:hypothetical protein